MNSQVSRFQQDFATIVAEMAIRGAIRPFLRTPSLRFVVVVWVPDRRDIFTYELIARKLLEGDDPYDAYGNKTVLVDVAVNDNRTDWLATLRHVRRAIFFAPLDAKLSDQLSLVVDHYATLRMPSPRHFQSAARTLGLRLSSSEAEVLSRQSLYDLRLAFRPGRPASRILRRISAVPRREEQEPPSHFVPSEGRRLDDLVGYGEAKTWGLRLARDLSAWKRGELRWEDIDRGVLLSGPPGSGKTTYASALARSCEVPLITASAAQWQAEGHLGDLLNAMRKTFSEAASRRPCIVFIDEFDSLGDRSVGKGHEYHDYKRRVVNGALECIDPAGGREGIIVIGATNDAAAIDKALLRPGRLERIIDIQLPDEQGRQDILKYYLPGAVLDDLRDFIGITHGWSGADIEMLARDARRIARESGRACVEPRDLSLALPPLQMLSTQQLLRLAVHEAGHAIVGQVLRPENLIRVSIAKCKTPGTQWAQIGSTEFIYSFAMANADQYTDLITIQLSGVAAENLIYGDHASGAGGDPQADLSLATDIATQMERSFGFGEGWLTDMGTGPRPLEYLRLMDSNLQAAVKIRLDAAYERASEILRTKLTSVRRLASLLVERLEVDADVVREICAKEGTRP